MRAGNLSVLVPTVSPVLNIVPSMEFKIFAEFLNKQEPKIMRMKFYQVAISDCVACAHLNKNFTNLCNGYDEFYLYQVLGKLENTIISEKNTYICEASFRGARIRFS